ncbi:hypothetical protein D3C84_634740 [compost metagenome]
MDAIGLHHLRHAPHSLQEERHQRHLLLCCQGAVDIGESRGVADAVVGRQAHAEQKHRGALLPGAVDHAGKILLQLCGGLAPQAIVAAELDDHQFRPVFGEQGGKPGKPASTGVAADGGVHHPLLVALLGKAFFQQRDPALAGFQPKSSADTIADDQQGPRHGLLRQQQQGQASAQQPGTHWNLHERKHSRCAEP